MHTDCFEVWQNSLLSRLNKSKEGQKKLRTGLRSRNCRTCGSSSKAIIWFLRPVPANVVREQSGNISTGCHLNPTAQDQTVTVRSRRGEGRRAIRTASLL